MLGLEYSAPDLVDQLRRQAPASALDIVLNGLPGAAMALLLGWGPASALALFGVTAVSSSGIVAKVLSDLGRLGNPETPTILGILVLEDLTMAVYLPIFTALLATTGTATALRSIAVALFVFFGLSTDPTALPSVLLPASALAVLRVGTKLATGWVAAGRTGVGPAGRIRAGAALVPRGEFSIVVAGLAGSAVHPSLAPTTTAYILIMAVLGPLMPRLTDPWAAAVARRASLRAA